MGQSQLHKRLVLLGAGGNVYDVLDTIEAINRLSPTWNIVGILDDHRSLGSEHLGLPILGPISAATGFKDCAFISAIWNEAVIRHLHDILAQARLDSSSFTTVIHPAATVSRRSHLGNGVVIHQSASIAGDVTIGEHVSIGPGCIIGHGTTIVGCTAIAAGAIISGNVRVDRNCYIGSGSMIRQHTQIGEGTLVGMGAVVVASPPAGTTLIGNPARPLVRAPDSAVENFRAQP